MMLKNNYYFSAFFWSTAAKLLNALFGFISVPLLLALYGKAEYGILSIAAACNGYMNLLDLGMNTGAVRFFSQWKAEGNQDLVYRVAKTNITFYLIVSIINALCLVALALWGEPLFAVTHSQFNQLQICLFVIAIFSVFSWCTTAYNQLLIADKQMSFTMKVNCTQTILKAGLIFIVLYKQSSLSTYFFFLTLIVALAIIPYSIKCKKDKLIDSLRPAVYWRDFKVVLIFSLSIFALSLFQMTATQSRPIILSIFAPSGADAVAEFRIIEVVPQLIIMIGGTFSGIFLPKAAEIVTRNNQIEIENFAYKWTKLTTIVVCCLSLPFMISSTEVLAAYVGSEYSSLSKWLVLWCFLVICQMHSTPANSLILAHGKTKVLVIVTAISCVLSIIINVLVCQYMGVGSAVVGYTLYIIFILIFHYTIFYRKYLNLSISKLFGNFFTPVLIAFITGYLVSLLPISHESFNLSSERFKYLLSIICKSTIWFIIYGMLLVLCRVIDLKIIKNKIIS